MNNNLEIKQKNFKDLLKKFVNRETVSYGFFGVITSFENILLFQILRQKMDYRSANLITLIIVKLTAYVLNKNFVFRSRTGSVTGLMKEFCRFLVARGLTMVIDMAGLMLLVECFSMPKLPGKIVVTVFVIILNYFIGKKHVFKDRK